MRQPFIRVALGCIFVSACAGAPASDPDLAETGAALWGTTVQAVEQNALTGYNQNIGIDGLGNVVAVWQQWDGTRYTIWGNRYGVGTGWGTARNIGTALPQTISAPTVAMDFYGNAVAAWSQYDGTRYNVWANRMLAGGAWLTPVLIENSNDDTFAPRVAMDAFGDAMVVWSANDGTRQNVWAARYSSSGWAAPELVENHSNTAMTPALSMSVYGSAFVTWQEFDGTKYSIWASHADVGAVWSPPFQLDSVQVYEPHVAAAGSGDAMAMWMKYDGTKYRVIASRYTAAAGTWSAPAVVENNVGSVATGTISLAWDWNGASAVAAWLQPDATGVNNVWSARFAGVSWSAAALVEHDSHAALAPNVAVDGVGNAVVAWVQTDGTRYNVWAARRSPTTGFGAPALIEQDNSGSANSPKVAMDLTGNTNVVWYQYDGTRYNIVANRDVVADVDQWLAAHANVASAMKWQYRATNSTNRTVSTSDQRPWSAWSEVEKDELRWAFVNAWMWFYSQASPYTSLWDGMNDPPYNLDSTLNPYNFETHISGADARTMYIHYMAQELLVEIGHQVPWTVTGYAALPLAMLFDSAQFFRMASDGSYLVGYPQIDNLCDTGSAVDNPGRSVPAPPEYTYAFLRQNAIVGSTRLLTISGLMEWSRQLVHFYAIPGRDQLTYSDFWQYQGAPPASRVITGTTCSACSPPLFAHYTFGCIGSAAFFKEVLRAVNIPVEILWICGHHHLYFPTEGLYLNHADNMYEAHMKAHPEMPELNLLANDAKFTSWFGASRANSCSGSLCGNLDAEITELFP